MKQKSRISELTTEINFLESRLEIWVARLNDNPDTIIRRHSLIGFAAVASALTQTVAELTIEIESVKIASLLSTVKEPQQVIELLKLTKG